ncbi:hypothetical protein Peur_044790 [Populus x canadensis]
MLSAVPLAFWPYVLKQVRVLFNSSSSSLTDAFCIAILEAASCGLLTVRTRVGEVLPDDKILLAEPDPSDMVRSNGKAISLLPNIDPQLTHNRVNIVSDRPLKCPDQNSLERLSRYFSCGSWAGKNFCLVMIIFFFLWLQLQLWQPMEDIEEVPEFTFPHHQYEEMISNFIEDQSLG